MSQVDLLAIAAHRDDVELLCGGTLAKAARAGYRTGILDLTAGELGTRGTAELRAAEAEAAAKTLGVSVRENLGLPDAAIVNDPATREQLARVLRRLQPRVVIAPALEGRHPDHRVTAQLVRDASFVSGLAKLAPDLPKHRPFKILHCLTYRHDPVRPTFVVDISDVFELKLEAIRRYRSQFEGLEQAGEVYPNGEPLEDVVRHYSAYYGTLIRKRYGEPYFTSEVMAVDDVLSLEVSTF
ncbi:MAG TPA: bacillithiol biosynthesis deacetylase BshB1 [Gemmatimonadaceae bacterium]